MPANRRSNKNGQLPTAGPLSPQTPTSAARRRKPHAQPTASSTQHTPRKSRSQATPQPTQPPAQQAPPPGYGQTTNDQARSNQRGQEVAQPILSSFLSIFSFFKDIFVTAIKMLRWPLALLVFASLLGIIVARLGTTLSNALSPFCNIPGLPPLPFCPVLDIAPRPNYPRLVEMQNNAFDKVLDETSGGSALALEIKKSEMATADLATLVRFSKLTSKELLADTLIQFVEEAKVTSKSLQKLSAKVGGAVDTIMAVNEYALQSIAAAHASETSKYSIRAFLPGAQTREKTNQLVLHSFNSAMETSSRHLNRLIIEAQFSLTDLDKLEERLGTLHELVAMEDKEIVGKKEDLLALLWTKLGGNQKALKDAEEHLKLLKEVGGYRKKALAHVVGAIQTLQGMDADLEDLRERVAAPELTGDQIPVEVHMRSIQIGLERLREGRSRTREVEEGVVRKIIDGS